MYPSLLSSAVFLPDSKPMFSPVEELHAKFEEEERQKTHVWCLHDEAYNYIMEDMPVLGDKTRIGFSNVAVGILTSYGQEVAAETLRAAKWSLHQLLTTTDAHLHEAGLCLSISRQRILDLINTFHQTPWLTLNSLRLPDNKKSMDMRTSLEVASRLCLQLYVDCCSATWFMQHLPDKAEARRALRQTLGSTLAASADVVAVVQQIFSESRKRLPRCRPLPVDFIGPKIDRPVPRRFFFTKPLLLTVMFGTITLVALHQFGFQMVALSPFLARLRAVFPWSLA